MSRSKRDDLPTPEDLEPFGGPQTLADPRGGFLEVEAFPGEIDENFLQMALDEAEIWGLVRHRNVLGYLGARQQGGVILVYGEHVPGWGLDRLLRGAARQKAPVPEGVASAIGAELLLGAEAIHETRGPEGEFLGFVHRIIEPRAIVVGLDGVTRLRCPEPVRLWERRGCMGPAATLKGMIPRTMAPEQIRGLPVDRRTDVYACAAVLWELLAGRRIFVAGSELEMLQAIIEGKIEPPSALRPGLNPAIDPVVLRGLATRPEDRYPRAAELLAALVAAAPPASPGEVAAWAAGLGVEPGSGWSSRRRPPEAPEEEVAAAGGPYRGAWAKKAPAAPAAPAAPTVIIAPEALAEATAPGAAGARRGRGGAALAAGAAAGLAAVAAALLRGCG